MTINWEWGWGGGEVGGGVDNKLEEEEFSLGSILICI